MDLLVKEHNETLQKFISTLPPIYSAKWLAGDNSGSGTTEKPNPDNTTSEAQGKCPCEQDILSKEDNNLTLVPPARPRYEMITIPEPLVITYSSKP